jgi:hypothetical protein
MGAYLEDSNKDAEKQRKPGSESSERRTIWKIGFPVNALRFDAL